MDVSDLSWLSVQVSTWQVYVAKTIIMLEHLR